MNGVDPRELPIEDAIDIAFMLENTGRAADPRKWITAWKEEAEGAAMGAVAGPS